MNSLGGLVLRFPARSTLPERLEVPLALLELVVHFQQEQAARLAAVLPGPESASARPASG